MTRQPNNSGHSTDSKSVMVYLDPVVLEALDAGRGDETRAKYLLRMAAKGLKLKNYEPRGRGKPKIDPENQD
jgi:hypothetical protein